MPALVRSETSDCTNPTLDLFVKDGSGNPVNASSVEFQIFENVSTPGVPVQIYPSTLGARQAVDLSDCPAGDRVSTGRYVAEYTVPNNALIGTWEIRWFVTLSVGSPEQTFVEEFEVLSSAVLGASDTYISVSDVRAAGLNSSLVDDASIAASICLWQQILERATSQWFSPISLEMYLDGTDSDTLHLPVPIISVEELRVNDSTDALDESLYRVYNGRRLPDDRKNPRIALIGNTNRDIFTSYDRFSRLRFFTGKQNQYVKGVFGYTEADGSTPEAIRRALLKLVIRDLGTPLVDNPGTVVPPPPLTSGVVSEEWTDGHKIKYQVSGGEYKPRAPGLAGLIDDPAVQRIITLYKAPIGMATPANPTWT